MMLTLLGGLASPERSSNSHGFAGEIPLCYQALALPAVAKAHFFNKAAIVGVVALLLTLPGQLHAKAIQKTDSQKRPVSSYFLPLIEALGFAALMTHHKRGHFSPLDLERGMVFSSDNYHYSITQIRYYKPRGRPRTAYAIAKRHEDDGDKEYIVHFATGHRIQQLQRFEGMKLKSIPEIIDIVHDETGQLHLHGIVTERIKNSLPKLTIDVPLPNVDQIHYFLLNTLRIGHDLKIAAKEGGHGDVEMNNVLILPDGQWKLIDWEDPRDISDMSGLASILYGCLTNRRLFLKPPSFGMRWAYDEQESERYVDPQDEADKPHVINKYVPQALGELIWKVLHNETLPGYDLPHFLKDLTSFLNPDEHSLLKSEATVAPISGLWIAEHLEQVWRHIATPLDWNVLISKIRLSRELRTSFGIGPTDQIMGISYVPGGGSNPSDIVASYDPQSQRLVIAQIRTQPHLPAVSVGRFLENQFGSDHFPAEAYFTWLLIKTILNNRPLKSVVFSHIKRSDHADEFFPESDPQGELVWQRARMKWREVENVIRFLLRVGYQTSRVAYVGINPWYSERLWALLEVEAPNLDAQRPLLYAG